MIKAIEAHNASLRGLLQQTSLFAFTRHVPPRLTRELLKFVDTQWIKTAGLDAGSVLGSTLKLPTRFHDEVLLAVYDDLIKDCPLLSAARGCAGGGSLPPLLRLLQPQVVLQKQVLMGDSWPCSELYILQKGTLQAELSLQVRVNLENAAGAHHARRGGGDLTGGAAAGLSGANLAGTNAAAELAAAVQDSLAQPSYRGSETKIGTYRASAGESKSGPASPPPSPPRPGSPGGSPGGMPALDETSSVGEDHLAALAGLSGAQLGGVAASGGDRPSAAPKRPQRGHGGGGKRNWKANLQSRHILEMPGSMVGIADPLHGKPKVSPYVVTALKQCIVFVIPKAQLTAVLNLMPFEEQNALCAAVQAQYNRLCKQLKANELVSDTVDKRKEEHDKTEEKSRLHAAGLAHPSNVAELAERCAELEMFVDQARITSATLRESCRPLLFAKKLIDDWAAERGVDLEHYQPPASALAVRPPFGAGAGLPPKQQERHMSLAARAAERRKLAAAMAPSAPPPTSAPAAGGEQPSTWFAPASAAAAAPSSASAAAPGNGGGGSSSRDSNNGSTSGKDGSESKRVRMLDHMARIDEARGSATHARASVWQGDDNGRKTVVARGDDDAERQAESVSYSG